MYDYLTKIDVNCPIEESERKRRLSIHKPAAEKGEDKRVVFRMNDVFLDVCDASYQQLGWGIMAFLFAFPFTIYGAVQCVEFTDMEDVAWAFWALFVGFCLLGGICLWALFRDCFGYRHKTVRFNRKNRMVYAFRHNGPGGVVTVPWDKAFFFPHRQASYAMMGGAPTVMRCYVLAEDGKTIKDTFSFGLRVVNGGDEGGAWGKEVLHAVLANFEFIRQFMEEGPANLSVERYMPEGPSLKASFAIWFDGFREVGLIARALTIVAAVPMVFMSIFHYIAQLTSREPVWPEDVQRASEAPQTSVAPVAQS
ncbi:hypothetical protein G3N59_08070 [Paraburkholderia sp. Ac-20340]|uniref:DUF6708 domain-containing protein n=1 Tax=Paraburkholderia sp. Ac-20340 TaxID=2703888 RepID=UPI0019809EAD|nr:DUF6708 domain-containing protein [Paraburkholderia sp. Ac-20340]MBN3853328.1 hypothetical protein [Paraburkholderia sp. Ac-20340]